MLLDVRMKIHCSAPFTTLRLIRRANAAEILVAIITPKSTPFVLVITQCVCISQSPQRRKQGGKGRSVLSGSLRASLRGTTVGARGGGGSILLGAGPSSGRATQRPVPSCRAQRAALYPECQGPASPGSLMIFWELCEEA